MRSIFTEVLIKLTYCSVAMESFLLSILEKIRLLCEAARQGTFEFKSISIGCNILESTSLFTFLLAIVDFYESSSVVVQFACVLTGTFVSLLFDIGLRANCLLLFLESAAFCDLAICICMASSAPPPLI